MTREEELDWLYRLKSKIYVYMPKEWIIPMSDALNTAIKALEYDDAKYHAEHGEVIVDKAVWEDAKRALEQQQKWIPVSERLPQINEWVVCQCRANIYEVLKFTSYGWYHDDAHCYMNGFVIAWMPLPEPYKPQKGAKNDT